MEGDEVLDWGWMVIFFSLINFILRNFILLVDGDFEFLLILLEDYFYVDKEFVRCFYEFDLIFVSIVK